MKPARIMEIQANTRYVRIATALFFFWCVPMSIWESSVQSAIFVSQDPVATAGNLLANEFAFRASIVAHLFDTAAFTLMAFLFYRVFSPVDKHLARLMVLPIVAQIAIVFLAEAINYTALMTLKAEPRPTFDVAAQQEAMYYLFRLYRYAIAMNKIVFGFFFIPLGILVIRSGFAPRLIGGLMILGGVGYLADTSLYVMLQRSDYLNISMMKIFSSATYSLALLWFLVKGVRKPAAQKAEG